MCAQYSIQTDVEVLKDLGIDVGQLTGEINQRVLPYTKVPVVVSTPQTLKLTPMNYSLIPSWSKEPKVKFATHNARIETVTEKPAWREPFLKQHCLLPMTAFYESVYEGPHAGHVISFSPVQSMLFAAGLFDVWTNPATKDKLFSCAILTTEPSAFIRENGHDRTPIFLNFADGKEWLNMRASAGGTSEREMVDFLLFKNVYPDLQVTRDRPLKPGWEKRA